MKMLKTLVLIKVNKRQSSRWQRERDNKSNRQRWQKRRDSQRTMIARAANELKCKTGN